MKRLALISAVIMLSTFLVTVVSAQSEEIREQIQDLYKSITVVVDGKKVDNVKNPVALVDQEDGRVMVPIDTVSSALGVDIKYDQNNNALTVVTPKPVIAKDLISSLAVLRNVGPFYTSNDSSVTIAQNRFGTGLLVDNSQHERTEFVVRLDQKYQSFETYIGVEDSTQNSLSNFMVSFYADDRLLDSPALRINEDNPIKPAQYARWIKYDGLQDVKRLTIRVEFIPSEDEIGDYTDLTAAFGNFHLIKK